MRSVVISIQLSVPCSERVENRYKLSIFMFGYKRLTMVQELAADSLWL